MGILEYIGFALAFFIQNLVFTTVSRARNRDKLWWGFIASIASNGVWIFVIRELIPKLEQIDIVILYIIMTSIGSTFGMWVNRKIEKKIGAKT